MADGPTDSVKSATLFLSYARADEPFARKLATALEQAGFTIWWDAMIEGGAGVVVRRMSAEFATCLRATVLALEPR